MTRGRGERGTAMVAGLVLLFAFTAGAVVWLARDVDRAISNRGSAQSIAFQVARSGAQQLDAGLLRADGGAVAAVDERAARDAATQTASRLFTAYGLDGEVTGMAIAGDRVTVTVVVHDGGRSVTGTGSARAQVGP